MKKKIGIAGTDGRSYVWAKEVTRGETQGVIIRGNRAMQEYARLTNCPLQFIPTKDNSAESLAQAGIEAFKNGQLDYLLAMSENHYYDGFVDMMIKAGFGNQTAGLTQAASFIEGDKAAAKHLCREAAVPVAHLWNVIDARDFRAVRDICCSFIEARNGVVLKYPYRAGGKGARVITDILQIGDVYRKLMEDYSKDYKTIHGNEPWPLLIESLLGGSEISLTVLVDDLGNFQLLPTSMDYARRYPGPAGPENPVTGGMGAISPHPFETEDLLDFAKEEIIQPFIKIMKAKGYLRKCILYFGCFVTVEGNGRVSGIRVCEVNIRPGEPEGQVVMRRIANPDELLLAMFENRLNEVEPQIRDQISLTIALVAGPGGPKGQKGYPWDYTKHEILEIDRKYLTKNNIHLIPSGADFEEGQFFSDGTRICYLAGNAKREPGKLLAKNAEALRNKLLNAYLNGKVRVIPRENENGNRLALREDCGLDFIKFAELFAED